MRAQQGCAFRAVDPTAPPRRGARSCANSDRSADDTAGTSPAGSPRRSSPVGGRGGRPSGRSCPSPTAPAPRGAPRIGGRDAARTARCTRTARPRARIGCDSRSRASPAGSACGFQDGSASATLFVLLHGAHHRCLSSTRTICLGRDGVSH